MWLGQRVGGCGGLRRGGRVEGGVGVAGGDEAALQLANLQGSRTQLLVFVLVLELALVELLLDGVALPRGGGEGLLEQLLVRLDFALQDGDFVLQCLRVCVVVGGSSSRTVISCSRV